MSILVNGKEKYRLDEIEKYNARFNFIWGGRNIGKTYACKEKFITDFWNDKENCKFAYVRRWQADLKRKYCEQYFQDSSLRKYIIKLTKGMYNCITFKEDKFYFALENLETGKKEIGLLCGFAFALGQQERYKSLNYSGISQGIFEEWITNQRYLDDEPNTLLNLISTIARDNNNFKLYMCANTISRVTPYFNDWGLSNITRQKQGEIDIYYKSTGEYTEKGEEIKVKIACEYCKETDTKNAFFKKTKTSGNMITGGEWYTDEYPKIPYPKEICNICYRVVFEHNNFKFLLELMTFENYVFWYVTRKTTEIKMETRIVGNIPHNTNLWTNDFIGLSKSESECFKLLQLGHIYYSDNLSGEEFKTCYYGENKTKIVRTR